MKKIIIMFAVALLSPQFLQAQGTMTYLSNLDQASTGSSAIGSDSWLASIFNTGTNPGGYILDSIQLGMADASGSPSNLMVMLYTETGVTGLFPGSSLGTLDGSLNPAAGGIYTFASVSNLMLLPNTYYFIVLTAGTTVANGAYEWSVMNTLSYNPSDGWGAGGIWKSGNGLTWLYNSGGPQFAINATAIPEPGVLGLLGLSGLAFLWHRRKAKAV